MSRTEIKICGVRTEQDVDIAAAAGADIVGLIAICESRRRISTEEARALAERARARGLLVAGVLRASDLGSRATDHLDIVQLVGLADEAEGLHEVPRVHVVVPVVPGFEEDAQMPQMGIPHFDTASPIGGGTGQRFSVERLAASLGPGRMERSFIAGGLSPENVGEVVRRFAPRGVDVASGVERDGRLDADLAREFVQEVRHAQQ